MVYQSGHRGWPFAVRRERGGGGPLQGEGILKVIGGA